MHASSKRNLAARIGGWSARRRWTALALWVAFVAAAVVAGAAAGQINLKESQLADGEAGRAATILDQAKFKQHAGEMVLIRSDTLTPSDPAFRAAEGDVVRTLAAAPGVINLRDPFAFRAGAVTRHSALVQFDVAGDSDSAADRVGPIMDRIAAVQRAHPGLTVGEFGTASADKVLNDKSDSELARARNLSLPLTLAILLVAFGAAVAAGVPVLLAFSAVLATFGLNSLVSHVFPTVDVTAEIILMIGMAVGVDYSLFYLARERAERAPTKDADRARVLDAKQALRAAKRAGEKARAETARLALREAKQASRENRSRALAVAASTSGQAVLISGLTVMVAMAGMLLAGDKTFIAIGMGSMLVVAAAVVGSLTGLPAMLSLLGDRVERGRLPLRGRRRAGGESRFWSAVLDGVLRRPAISAGVAATALVVAALPVFTLHTETPGFDFLPAGEPIVQTYNQVQHDFPGDPAPAVVALKAPDVTDARVASAIDRFKEEAVATGQMFHPIDVELNHDGTVAKIDVPLQGDGQNAASQQALTTLRDRVIPHTIGAVPGAEVAVTGDTAGSVDFNDLMRVRTPLVFAFVLGLAFVLMLVTFRSIVIPIKAIVLNLLSVGASYGILVAIFQKGIGESLLGFHSTGSIANWLPLFLFVVLFGLSMDYHVFILSRVRELVLSGVPTDEAVGRGIKQTAGVVTSAAVVMVGVFAIFGTLSQLDVKQFGVGAAIAVLLDATVIRAVLLPATMKLLGDWNWYLPRSLEWLPTLNHGSAPAPAPAPEPSPA